MSSKSKYTLINPINNLLNITKCIPTKIIYYGIIVIVVILFIWMLSYKDNEELIVQDVIIKLKDNNDSKIEIAKNEEEDVYEVVGYTKSDNYNYINY